MIPLPVIPSIKIPWQVWACAGLVLLLSAAGWKLYDLGQDHKQAEWDASIERGKVIVEKLKANQGKVTTKIVTQTVERIKVVTEKGDEIIKRVEVFVPNGTCELPGSFRVYHDAAADNAIPDSTRIPDAKPVPAKTLATTLAENYTTCHKAITDLQGLRQWVQEQHQLYLDQCKDRGVNCSKDTVAVP